jgi:hypothetical protein
VGDADERFASGQDRRDERVAPLDQLVDHRHRYRAVADDLTGLAGEHDAPEERVVVDPDEDLDRGAAAAGAARP